MLNAASVGMGGFGRRLVASVQGKGGNSATIRFVAGVARTPAKVADFAQEHALSLVDDLGQALADSAIDAVVVATPNSLHAGQAIQAATAGKHVMVIKPLALFRKEAEGLRGAAEDRQLVLAMGHDRCFLPAVDELRNRVKAGDLGRIIHAEGDFCVDRYFGLPEGDWKLVLYFYGFSVSFCPSI